jgi:DUF1680 family protein
MKIRTLKVLAFVSVVASSAIGQHCAVAVDVRQESSSRQGVTAKFERHPRTRFEIRGPLGKQIEGVVQNWLIPAPRDNPAMLDMFTDQDKQPYRQLLPWSGEFFGKYLTASTQMIRLTSDPRLQATVEKLVARAVTLQAEDGYLGPWPKEFRLRKGAPNCELFGLPHAEPWDAWGHYHAMVGLLLWHQTTADPKALACATRIADMLCDRFLDNPRERLHDTGAHEMNQAPVHSLALLYRLTGKDRYLRMAEQIVTEFAVPPAGDYLNAAIAGKEFWQTPKPRWESLHPIMGLSELHLLTGKEPYGKAFEHLWWSIVRADRHNTGGFSSGEKATGNPYAGGSIETCCTIAWIAMSIEMLRLTGDPIVADEIELSTLNSVVGMHSPDGAWCTYDTPMDGTRVPSTTAIAFQKRPGSEQLNCCSVNGARGFGMISDWAVMQEQSTEALILNWYGPSTISTVINDVAVTLRQETDYPRQGSIALHVEPKAATPFILKLRIPHWSTSTKCSINGQAVEAEAGSYCVLDRRWDRGDLIALEFDMRPRVWVGERECDGKASLYRGPILLALKTGAGESPPLDLARLDVTLVEPPERPVGCLLMIDVTDSDGKTLRLSDFGSVGHNQSPYKSWLKAKGVVAVPFAPRNPWRTTVAVGLNTKSIAP